jgi:hypothetical protein
MRRRRRRWWVWWWGWNIWCLLGMWGCKFFCFFRTRSRWGWNVLCTFRMWGCKFFLCFQDDEEVGMQVLKDEEEVQMEQVLQYELGNHLRKEPVPYCVNYKKSVS